LVLLVEDPFRDGANAFAVARSTTRARNMVLERQFMVVSEKEIPSKEQKNNENFDRYKKYTWAKNNSDV
jgi:hypothetical protein